MYAQRFIVDSPQAMIPVPPELQHRPMEVIFIALDKNETALSIIYPDANLAGCWQGEALQREAEIGQTERLEFA
jgi:hypothetical protein